MDTAMRPPYFGIRFAGIAHTAEYDLTDRPPTEMSYEEFDDMIVADDDGVVVVPQDTADQVARRAMLIQNKDRPGRRSASKSWGCRWTRQ